MVILYLHARVLPGRRHDLEAFLVEARPVYEEPEGISVRLQWSRTDPDVFAEIVEYRDDEVYEHDQQRVENDPRMRALLKRWHGLLAEGPRVEVYDESADLRA